MTINELFEWVTSKRFGRLLIERSESKHEIRFYVSCEVKDHRGRSQIWGVETAVRREEMVHAGSKQAVADLLSYRFDEIVAQFDQITHENEQKS